MPDKKEIIESLRLQEHERTLKQKYKILQFQYPVAELTKLQKDSNWNLYRSLLQGKVEQLKQSLDLAEERFKDPRVDDTELPRLKHTYLLVQAQVEAFTIAIDLPQMLIDDVDKAQKALNEFNPGVKEDSPTKEKKNGRKTRRSKKRTL